MKKSSGFMLFETLIVSTLVLGTLVFLFVQLTNIKRSYNVSFNYNTVEGLYKADVISKYLENTGYTNIKTQLGSNDYVDITNCVYSTTLCTSLLKDSNVKQILFTNQDITSLKANLDSLSNNDINKDFKKYIKHLKNTKEGYEYRIIIEYNDKTYASVGVGVDLSELTAYSASNILLNSGFEAGTTYYWTISGTSNNQNLTTDFKKSGQQSLSIITHNTSENKVAQNVSLKLNHIYYMSESIYLNNTNSGKINVYLNDANSFGNITFGTLRSKKWNNVSSIFTVTKAGTYSFNAAILNDINNIYIDNTLLIDLTDTFGSGNEPTLEWCDTHISYFDTTKTLYK